MLHTKFTITLSISFYLISTHSPLGWADSSFPGATSRDAIIQKQMDCVSRNLESTGVGEQDPCSTPDPTAQDQEEKSEAVNQQQNTSENYQGSASGVAQEFPNLQPNAEKEFSNTLHDAQKEFPNAPSEGQSAGDMLKELLSPDLSQNPGSKSPSDVKTRVHNLDGGPEIFYYRYQEPGVGVKIWGPMYGYFADYAYRPASPNFFNNFLTNVYSLQARYASSRDLEYKGSGIIKGKHDDVMEFRGLIGKDYFIGTDALITPYFGFGYRYLFDRGNGQISSTRNYGYDRRSHYSYLPLGGDARLNIPKDWEIGFNTEYDILLQGSQKSYLSDGYQFTGYHNPDITNFQTHGFGLRASIKFLKRGSMVDFYVEPYIRYWNIEQSDVKTATIDGVKTSLVEPKNNTIEIGSKLGIQF